MDYKEIKKLQNIVRKHRAAYSVGLNTDSENKYPVRSERYQAFNEGRLARVRKQEKRKG